MIQNNYIITMLIFLFSVTCKQGEPQITEQEYKETRDALVGVNRILVKKDREKIKGFIERRGLNMKETETGLWYMIDEKERGTGKPAEAGNTAIINYKVSLLDGLECYSSDESGPKEFLIGNGGVESGLEEGILMLKEGDKAMFIMPPHLAYGLIGDDNKIPKRAVIIYDVEVVAINDN